MSNLGVDLALLLLGGFRKLVDEAMKELAHRGHPDFRPVYEYALLAIDAGASNATDLGRRLSVSKQAAAKTIAVLQRRGYISVEPDRGDARRKKLRITELGYEVMQMGAEVFQDLRNQWAHEIGIGKLEALEAELRLLVGAPSVRIDTPGWMLQEDQSG
ncbi:MarR family transcriptional regulator [Rhizobium glycinendophyticum]|uniref:MarR family transcriptional regulator n=2 Tax=Rhizobium glycinendophyticum TaxID=2589807 RepID=A0A504UDZ6_9HYPH|nr:MarR family transcriptional regulator [Rhizobium glycinendophyticum]